ncbi:MAG: 3-deoxy-8-phosphooctulonate synthase [Bacteroidetes bacterium HGW-Bacteroidetes-15]|nr:3-deoxy-8-phosphooctulonate synthase [Flavobacteriaceae bacterium]MDZ4147045.1 3-deoxy-8-phosphooctulonate synthase [Flavobacteriaceae bacterium]PKP39834.1 MAG: 3-deoxy-8-phosphooctulonate synthase [Bacteroidetes bacterium HGW-Bacteroidetes-15]PKP43960.1 MAG: 3-deoxy-8-phosphooctulonate synthase [Bacteroidetes bacterium HGW-Bacteroidetes-13]
MSQKKVQVGNVSCGADQLFLISGPCVIETESIMMRTAETIKEVTEKLGVPVIYKSSFMKDNRSSADYYSGPGVEKGLRILEKIRKEFGFPILTDVHYPSHVKEVAEVVDVVQVPAYLLMQTSLVLEVAEQQKAVNLKHAQFLAPENMIKPVEKIESVGNHNILLTERGYVFGYNDLIVDPRSFYHMNEIGYPVIFDVTHSIRKYGTPSADPKGGARQYLEVLARAGVASGVDGLFVETHPCPSEALCDAASQLDMMHLEEFLKPLLELHNTEVKYRKK